MESSGMSPTAFRHASHDELLASHPHKTRKWWTWVIVGVIACAAMGALAATAYWSAPSKPSKCGSLCPKPPPGIPPIRLAADAPMVSGTRYVSKDFGYSVEYSTDFPQPSSDASSITFQDSGRGTTGDTIIVKGEAANGRTPQQVVAALQQRAASGASLVFAISGAELGYTDGYGGVYDLTVSPAAGERDHVRLLIEAATRDGVAVELLSESDYVPDQNQFPAPAQMDPAAEYWSDSLGNTVTWRNEPPF